MPLVNRALCNKKLENWDKVVADCETVIRMDATNLKAHFFLGQAHLSMNRAADAVANLNQALKLARKTESSIEEEVWRALARAKYESHSSEASMRAVRRADLLRRLKDLLREDVGRRLKGKDAGLPDIIDNTEALEADNSLLDEIFRSDELRYQGDDIPNWCTCQLTLDCFYEPVCTPSGISYEQNALLEHLSKVGEFDPVTRDPLRKKDLRKNIGLRNAVECYLNDNPWAFYHAM